MSYIEVKEHDPGPGNEHMSAFYPGNGLYWVARMNCYYAVANGASCMVFLGGGRGFETITLPTASQQSPAIDPIAMLAVALHPSAANEYVRKGGHD